MVASKARERQRKDRRATHSSIEREKSENPLVFTRKKGACRFELLSRVKTGGQEYILIRNKNRSGSRSGSGSGSRSRRRSRVGV